MSDTGPSHGKGGSVSGKRSRTSRVPHVHSRVWGRRVDPVTIEFDVKTPTEIQTVLPKFHKSYPLNVPLGHLLRHYKQFMRDRVLRLSFTSLTRFHYGGSPTPKRPERHHESRLRRRVFETREVTGGVRRPMDPVTSGDHELIRVPGPQYFSRDSYQRRD